MRRFKQRGAFQRETSKKSDYGDFVNNVIFAICVIAVYVGLLSLMARAAGLV